MTIVMSMRSLSYARAKAQIDYNSRSINKTGRDDEGDVRRKERILALSMFTTRERDWVPT